MFKRKLNSSLPIALLVILTAVCASAFAGFRDGTWEVNPSEFRYDMSMYFRMENADFEDLSSVEIGAFVDDECRGVAEKLELTQGESCLYMRIRSNKADGEKLTFLMRDKKTGQTVHVRGEDGSEITFKADTRIGLPSDPLLMEPYFMAVFKIDGEVFETLEVGYGDPIQAPQVPEKEGYTFNGWGDVPAAMPAYDIEMHSSYSVNYYNITFKTEDGVIYTGDLAYGSTIIAPEAPAKDGLVFVGWGDLPETMPAKDLEFTGVYKSSVFNVVYKIDGEVVKTIEVTYGDPIPSFAEVPEKEGYSFSGWTEVPELMPARDVEINGSYEINHYTVTFSIGDEVFLSQDLAYGEEIIVPEAPAREGYSFSGWGDVPAAMPASDLAFKGDYTVNTYTVLFRIDQEVFETLTLEYGAPISAPSAPEMEGHTFSGWGEVPATMPAYDLVFVGTYEDNYYTITFKVGDEVIKMADLAYESEIILPEVPVKEGYSFSGWGEVPATMPSSNIEIVGNYIVNNYKVTFQIDDEVIYIGELPYGSEILAPDAPSKEGCSFSGWGIVPATMPASDLVISGTYSVNVYTLTFLIDGELFYTTQVPYGSEISAPEAPVKEGYSVVGWSEMPSHMPAYDLNIDGSYAVNSYMLTFKVGDEVVYAGEIPYGTEIVAPEVPAKDGYSFSGWGMVPSTMPASDLEISGVYDVNIYNLTFTIDGEMFYSTMLSYGSEIVVPVVPEVEGKTFSGWGELPASMPANDLYVNGTYSVNYHLLTFRIGEEVFFSGEVAYGTAIVAPSAPEKQGYTFAGWGDVPASMPDSNVDLEGSYTPNSYTLKFMIGDEVIFESMVEYGTEIIVPDAPEKEGFLFLGWGVVPPVMPAQDVVVNGTYMADSFSILFKIGDDVFYAAQLPFGAQIVVPDVPEREGYTFSGWGEVPETMPAENIELTGTYVANLYTVVFKIDGQIVSSSEFAYGVDIIEPEVEDKEGYTFSGWGVVPNTMPASDLEFNGTYTLNYYTLTFKIDGEVVYHSSIAYGADISTPEVVNVEGYSLVGWEDVPATMPAEDLEFNATYKVNSYKLTFYVDGIEYLEEILDYGAEIILYIPDVPKGRKFDGWPEDVPATMPDHDLSIYGTTSPITAVELISMDADEVIDVYGVDGTMLLRKVRVAEACDRLSPGIYIVNGEKMILK